MTKTEAQRAVKAIRDLRNDPEAAHGVEDALHIAALQAIAEGNTEDARGLARVALTSLRIKFTRR